MCSYSQLFIVDSTNLINLYTTNANSTATSQTSSPNIIRDTFRICLLFRIFRTVFNKLHEHSHTGIKITNNTFSQYYYILYFEKWLSIFLHDCIKCQRNKHFNMKSKLLPHNLFQNMLRLSITAFLSIQNDLSILLHTTNPTIMSYLMLSVTFKVVLSMRVMCDKCKTSKKKFALRLDKNRTSRILLVRYRDVYCNVVVTVPINSNNAKTAIRTMLHHWIIKFGPPIYLVTDRGSEYVNQEMAPLCTLMGIKHSPRTAYWTNDLVEIQNRNLGTHLRIFLHDTPNDWAF